MSAIVYGVSAQVEVCSSARSPRSRRRTRDPDRPLAVSGPSDVHPRVVDQQPQDLRRRDHWSGLAKYGCAKLPLYVSPSCIRDVVEPARRPVAPPDHRVVGGDLRPRLVLVALVLQVPDDPVEDDLPAGAGESRRHSFSSAPRPRRTGCHPSGSCIAYACQDGTLTEAIAGQFRPAGAAGRTRPSRGRRARCLPVADDHLPERLGAETVPGTGVPGTGVNGVG